MNNSPASQALVALQGRYCLSTVGGQVRILDLDQVKRVLSGHTAERVHLLKPTDGDLLMRRFLEAQPIGASAPAVIKAFKDSPSTLEVKEIAFTPRPTPSSVLNLWVPPAANPRSGDWSVIRHFLQDVLCGNDSAVFGYLVRYLAHMVQKPDEKPGVMLVFLGGQGTGKGMFFRLLERIWPLTTLVISDMDHALGRFNAALERSYAVCLDEALFYGDRRAQDKLKSLITEPVIVVEEKQEPRRQMRSIHRLFAASNHEQFAQVERDDRRMVIIRVSSEYQQNTTYFARYVAAINDQRTVDAMFYDLLNLDLADFDIRMKPVTSELARQKLMSLSGFDRYWYEVLSTGDLSPAGRKSQFLDGFADDDRWSEPMFVPTSTLVQRYRTFDPAAGRHQTVQQTGIHQRLKVLCPSAEPDRKTVESRLDLDGNVKRGYNLPSLVQARVDFERFFDMPIDWDGNGVSGCAPVSGKSDLIMPSDAAWLTDIADSQLDHLLPSWVASAE